MLIFIHGTSLICCTTSRIAAGHEDSASCSRTLQQGRVAFWRTASLLLTHPAASFHANPANYIAPFWFFPLTPLISIVCPFLPPLICPLLTCWVWASQCQPALWNPLIFISFLLFHSGYLWFQRTCMWLTVQSRAVLVEYFKRPVCFLKCQIRLWLHPSINYSWTFKSATGPFTALDLSLHPCNSSSWFLLITLQQDINLHDVTW